VGSNAAGQDITDVTIANNIMTNTHRGISVFPVSLTDELRAHQGRREHVPPGADPWVLRLARHRFRRSPGPRRTCFPQLGSSSTIASSRTTAVRSAVPATDLSYGILLAQTRGVKVVGNNFSNLYEMAIWIQGSPYGEC
jgi:hypothetical protein